MGPFFPFREKGGTSAAVCMFLQSEVPFFTNREQVGGSAGGGYISVYKVSKRNLLKLET